MTVLCPEIWHSEVLTYLFIYELIHHAVSFFCWLESVTICCSYEKHSFINPFKVHWAFYNYIEIIYKLCYLYNKCMSAEIQAAHDRQSSSDCTEQDKMQYAK